MKKLPWDRHTDEEDIETGPEALRASGESLCPICGLEYFKHRKPYKRSCPSIVVACDGAYLKL